MPRVVRKQKPPRLADYRSYKPYLRLDFDQRCAYCHIPELRYGPPGNYSVDHFRPKSRSEFQRLVCYYPNLFYTCMDCNRSKGNTWPHPHLCRQGFRFLNPCRDNMSKHWDVDRNGLLIAKTFAAEYTIARLRLNRVELCEWRRDKVDLIATVQDAARAISLATGDALLVGPLRRVLERLRRKLDEEYANYWT